MSNQNQPSQPAAARFAFLGALRTQLFLGSALLTSTILLFAAWVINHQVVTQARAQLQTEVGNLLPLYDAVLDERLRRLATISATMAGSPVVKAVLGNESATRDQATLHEMFADISQDFAQELDLKLISDGAGLVVHAEGRGSDAPQLQQLEAARVVSEQQKPAQSFAQLNGKVFQLALTPVLLQAGSGGGNNTLAVLGAGRELDREFATELKRRLRGELLFFVGARLYLSSLTPEAENQAAQLAAWRDLKASPDHPVELSLGNTGYLAFARPLTDFTGQRIGQVVILRSLAGTAEFFSAVTRRLLWLGALSIALAWALSFWLAGRMIRPLAALAAGARELGEGHTDYPVPVQAQGEIGQLARAFDQMRQSLAHAQDKLLKKERQLTIGQMALILDDLRQPLTTITSTAEALNKSSLSLTAERRHALLESQWQAAKQMKGMLIELLEFAQGRYQVQSRTLAFAALVNRLGRQFQTELLRAGITLNVIVPPELVFKADEEKLRRVLEILLAHAIQAMPQGGTLTVEAQYKDGRVRIGVNHNGASMPAALREQLFEPFSQNGASGLGLAIARGLVEAHGGIIRLVESPEPGAHFLIDLPWEKAEAQRQVA